jgi:hypothetical protein
MSRIGGIKANLSFKMENNCPGHNVVALACPKTFVPVPDLWRSMRVPPPKRFTSAIENGKGNTGRK